MNSPRLFLLLVVAGVTLGCGRVTPASIEGWKNAPDGADRLHKVVVDARQPADLRGLAVAALVAMGDLARAEAATAGIPIEDRGVVVAAAISPLAAGLNGGDVRRAEDARDALYGLRQQSTSDAAKKAIDAALLPVVEKEMRAGRAVGVGRFSALQVCQAMGPGAYPLLHKLLADQVVGFGPVTDILEKIGDKAARERGGSVLADRARGQGPLPKEMAEAMGRLGGKDATAFLVGKVEPPRGETAAHAVAGLVKLQRDETLLPLALRLAGAAETDVAVRAGLFELVERFYGEEPRKGLVKLIAGSTNLEIVARAFAAALKVNGPDAAVPALEAFSSGLDLNEAFVKEKILKPVIEMRFDGRAAAFKALESKSPLCLLIAIWYLDDGGFPEDSEQMLKLVADKRGIKGLPKTLTLGAEAARVAAKLKKPAGG